MTARNYLAAAFGLLFTHTTPLLQLVLPAANLLMVLLNCIRKSWSTCHGPISQRSRCHSLSCMTLSNSWLKLWIWFLGNFTGSLLCHSNLFTVCAQIKELGFLSFLSVIFITKKIAIPHIPNTNTLDGIIFGQSPTTNAILVNKPYKLDSYWLNPYHFLPRFTHVSFMMVACLSLYTGIAFWQLASHSVSALASRTLTTTPRWYNPVHLLTSPLIPCPLPIILSILMMGPLGQSQLLKCHHSFQNLWLTCHTQACHRPWYLVGGISQLKWHNLLKASWWSKWQQTVINQSSQPIIEWWLKNQNTFWCHVLCGMTMWSNPPPHQVNYLTKY